MMELQVCLTDDGSGTVYSEKFRECYHSSSGAVTESMHVFINAGLRHSSRKNIRILEVGFGTGLNTLLTYLEAKEEKFCIDYTTIELFPLQEQILEQLSSLIKQPEDRTIFRSLHESAWEKYIAISPTFSLKKVNTDILSSPLGDGYDLVYFDAFSPVVQPELWSDAVFEKIFNAMTVGGMLTTYCAKGAARRSMQKAGFIVERLPGPPQNVKC